IRGHGHQLAAEGHARHGLPDVLRLAEELRVSGSEPEHAEKDNGGADHDDGTPVARNAGYRKTNSGSAHGASLRRAGAGIVTERPLVLWANLFVWRASATYLDMLRQRALSRDHLTTLGCRRQLFLAIFPLSLYRAYDMVVWRRRRF